MDLPIIEEVLAKIRSLGINFIAIDFDQTLIDTHTGGRYPGTVHDIISHVRPIFIELITAALQPPPPISLQHTIHIAIVTYSKQPALIRSILEHLLDVDMASRIIIRGNDKSWSYEGNGMKDGKQSHMASAVEEILHHHHIATEHDTFINNPPASTENQTNTIATQPVTVPPVPSAAAITTNATLIITRETSLLIDDDTRNIRIALRNGTRAIWYNPNALPQQLYHDFAQLV